MKNKIILFGDQHVTHEEPFFSAKKKYFQDIANRDFNNNSNVAIFMGDFFHSNTPTPKEYELAHKFIESLRFKEVYILAGNGVHEYNRSKDNWAIDPLAFHEYIFLIKKPDIYNIGKLKMLFLPWVPGKYYNDLTMKEWYENLTEYKDKEFDYMLGHFNHKEFFGHIIDISYLKTKNIRMGHIHIPDGDYVGVDTITRYDEKGILCNLNIIDMETGKEEFLTLPRYFDYYEIKYGEDVSIETPYFKLDIIDAPSKEKAYQKYGQYHIRNIVLKNEDIVDSSNDNKVRKFDKSDFITKFIKEKKITKIVEEKVRSVV